MHWRHVDVLHNLNHLLEYFAGYGVLRGTRRSGVAKLMTWESISSYSKGPPQRWLSLSRTFDCVIVLWYYIYVLCSNDGKIFPLDITNNILELYSLVVPCASLIRESQHGSEPVVGKIHSLVTLFMASTVDPDKPLQVRRVKGEVLCCVKLIVGRRSTLGGPLSDSSSSRQ